MQQLTKLSSFINYPIRNCLFTLATAVLLVSCGGGGSSTPTHTVGGIVSGLTSGSLVLKNNNGDDLTISANSTSFTFATALASGAAYAVTVATQPSGLTCSMSSGGGTIASANVTNVVMACVPLWIGTKQLGVAGQDTAGRSVATDANGNVYVAGYTFGGLDGNTLTGTYNFFVTKYNSSGVKQYTRQLGAGQNTQGRSVATDANGNVYVAGWTTGGLDGNTRTGDLDFFVTKYDSSGVKQYTKQLGVAGQDTAGRSVATDANGNVYVAGYTFGGLDGNTLTGTQDFFVTKYDGSGVKQYTRQLGVAGKDTQSLSVATDANGNVYVSGYTWGDLDGNTLTGTYDQFVTKYDSSGVKQYTRQLGVSGASASGWSVAIDANGNVYVAGSTTGSHDGNTLAGTYDFLVTKYNSNGVKQYTRQLGITEKNTAGRSVATDANGNVYVAGDTFGGLDGNTLTGIKDFFVTKYNSSGVKQYTRQLGVTGLTTNGWSVATDADGNVYVAGQTDGGLDGNTLTGTKDFFVTKYNSSGVKQ
jgi:uncharacterized delta-60 repeat protein